MTRHSEIPGDVHYGPSTDCIVTSGSELAEDASERQRICADRAASLSDVSSEDSDRLVGVDDEQV